MRTKINYRPNVSIQASQSDPELKIYCRAGSDGAELMVFDNIGENIDGTGIGAREVSAFLADNAKNPVNVRINSFGGLAYDGLVIYNSLVDHPQKVTTTIEGIAFSAAAFIAMAGDTVRMRKNSDIGIHRAWGIAAGNSAAMADIVKWLQTMDQHQVDIFSQKTGKPRATIEKWLEGDHDGTLFNAEDAVKHGFADEIIGTASKSSGRAEKLGYLTAAARRRFDRMRKGL